MFNDQARRNVFQFLQGNGYQGTAEVFWNEMRHQSYLTEIELFRQSRIIRAIQCHKGLKEFVDKVFAQLVSRFDSLQTDRAYAECAYISFNCSSARRQEVRSSPLRLDGVTLEFEELKDFCRVRVKAYLNNEFRRDKYFEFPRTGKRINEY